MYTHTPHSNEFVKENGVKRVSIMEFMQLCRLCLVKEQVNVSIFDEQGETRQICLKISSCLPVKVEKEDKLPKKICDGCLYKLDLLYQFYNTTATAEKQLLAWLEQANMDVVNDKTQPTVKQEKVEPAESTNENTEISPDAQTYIIQQQQLSYNADYAFKESQGSKSDNVNSEEPPTKRPRRRRQATKPIPPESLESSDNDNDNDNDIDNDNDAGDSMVEMAVTKTEEESESEGEENIDDPEPTKYEELGEDGEQPGPSGLGKGGADAPNHRRKTHFPKVWPCKQCDLEFNNRRQLAQHRKVNHPPRPGDHIRSYIHDVRANSYTCKTCDHQADSNDEMKKHLLTHETQYECDDCEEVFYCAYKYSIHANEHNSGQAFECPLCAYTTNMTASMEQHINKVHLKKYLYYCKYCGKCFRRAATHKEHEDGHFRTEPLMCLVCEKTFSFKRSLLRHQNKFHKTADPCIQYKNRCRVCDKSFSKLSSLVNHMKIHRVTEPKPQIHLCDTCGKTFVKKEKLALHRRVHTGYKPYKCNYCVKAFTKKEYLVMHERTHTGEKPYHCVLCDKSFSQGTSLKVHVRRHLGEKPYACHLCMARFVAKGALKNHLGKCKGPRV